MTLSIFLVTALGMAGIINDNLSHTPLNDRLFSIELFMILITPIFLAFSSLVKERKSASELLNNHIEQLEDAMQKLSSEDRSKNEFIAILAHELRNPLAPVMSTLELLKLEGNLNEESKKMIERARTQTYAMRRLLDDLLDVARVTQKKFKLLKEPTEITKVIQHSIESTGGFIESQNHTLSVSLPNKELWLKADPVRLEQVVVNLLNNAAKYTKPGGHIELSCTVEKNTLFIRVRDNGIGIPPEELQNIFRPFQQIKSKAYVGSGLGIGLSLTKRLVEMHEGSIQAYSEGPGTGSTFTVELPISKNVQLPIPETKKRHQGSDFKTSAFKILVVDDNEPAAQSLGKLLERRGHTTKITYKGITALNLISTFQPEIMLIDIGLPDIDGYEIARQLRKDNKYSSVLIALTGYGQDEDKLKAKSAGFDYHLTKPVTLSEIEVLLKHIHTDKTISSSHQFH